MAKVSRYVLLFGLVLLRMVHATSTQRENRKIADQISQFMYEGFERRERQQQDE